MNYLQYVGSVAVLRPEKILTESQWARGNNYFASAILAMYWPVPEYAKSKLLALALDK